MSDGYKSVVKKADINTKTKHIGFETNLVRKTELVFIALLPAAQRSVMFSTQFRTCGSVSMKLSFLRA